MNPNVFRNETFRDGVCIRATIIDLNENTVSVEVSGNVVESRQLTLEERQIFGPQPLDKQGSLATLLAVTGTIPLEDAANAVGLTPQNLIDEANAWAAAQEMNQ